MDTQVIKARKKSQVSAAAEAGAKALNEGKLVAFATETVYGIAAVASDRKAMDRLRELKSRPKNPFSVHIGSPDDAFRYVARPPAAARRLIRKAWPGPVTVLLPTGGKLSDPALGGRKLHDVLCAKGLIGLRCPDEPVARAMLSAVAEPVVAPSANPAGAPSPRTADDVLARLGGRIDLLIDSGPTRHGKDSTIVRFAVDGGWEIVRAGVFDERMIRGMTRRKVLFVCTGNTCRSPMAAGLAKAMLAERMGCKVSDLRTRGVEIGSAGLFASDGAKASPEAVGALRELGVDISRHRSRKLTGELAASSDMIFCMTDFHVTEVRRKFPACSGRVFRLNASDDIADPIGGGAGVYTRTAGEIAAALAKLIDEGQI